MSITVLLLAISALSLAQTSPENRMEFEAAAIRPAKQDDNHDSDTNKGRYRVHNFTLKQLVAHAYDIDVKLISGGPKWVDSDVWDIDAKIPAESLQRTRDTVPRMIQSLLADRFQLAIHREPQQISGFALVVTKNGPKMEQDRKNEGSKMRTRNTHLLAEGVTMQDLAKYLSRSRDVGKLVVDKTGLGGRFKFELEWKPERTAPTAPQESASDDPPPIFTALQTSLGLKLESAKIPISQIIIDRAEKPSEN